MTENLLEERSAPIRSGLTNWFRPLIWVGKMTATSRFAAVHALTAIPASIVLLAVSVVMPGAAALGPVAIMLAMTGMALAVVPGLTGRQDYAQAGSAFALAAFAAALSALTGGLQSPFLVWLIIAPVEAMMSGRRAAVVMCVAMSAAGVFALTGLSLASALPPSAIPEAWTPVLTALASGAALGAILLSLMDILGRSPMEQTASGQSALRAAAAGAPDLILRLSTEGRILEATDAARRLLGQEPSELVGVMPGMLVHIADFQTLQTALAEAASDQSQAIEPANIEVRLRAKSGAYVWVDMRLNQTAEGIFAIVRDAQRRKAREQTLIEARQEAEEASKSKSRFLASMSHELRTPLNAIIGFSDMIRQEVFGPVGNTRYREYATHIHSSGQHLVDMISDLLDMSKIEAGKFRLNLKPIDVAPLIDETLEMMRLQAEEAGVALSTRISVSLPQPMVDRRAVKQILLNLLSNAIKFTPAQGRVTVGARRVDGEVIIDVQDTGVGIPASELDRIGKPFEQVDTDLMRNPQKGTGLGLSLVSALAGLHGGRMLIESAPGDGTKVSVFLPLEPQDETGRDTIIYPERFRAGSKA